MTAKKPDARQNNGRPKGAKGKRTEAQIKKAEQGGAMPLDVMLADMRFHFAIAERLMGSITKKSKPAEFKAMSAAMARAREAAKDAAPYLHPRLNSIDHTGGVAVTFENALKTLEAAN